MAADREQLIAQVTQLATDHADLLDVVRTAISDRDPLEVVDGHAVLHVPLQTYLELQRLTT